MFKMYGVSKLPTGYKTFCIFFSIVSKSLSCSSKEIKESCRRVIFMRNTLTDSIY